MYRIRFRYKVHPAFVRQPAKSMQNWNRITYL
jgi:hypothetical protein